VDGLYENVDIAVPRLSDPEIFQSQPEFLRQSLNRERYFWRWETPEKYRVNLRAYYRMITGLDNVMNRVLAHLDKLGMVETQWSFFLVTTTSKRDSEDLQASGRIMRSHCACRLSFLIHSHHWNDVARLLTKWS